MTMTRKDYQLIVTAIRQSLDDHIDVPAIDNANVRHAIISTAHEIADELAADNPDFDPVSFIRACGIE